MRKHVALTTLLALLLTSLAHAQAWVEGKNYYTIDPAQQTSVPPGTIEVAEVFSYGCPFCAQFNPLIQELRKSLPAYAQLVFVPASFNPSDDSRWFHWAASMSRTLGLAQKQNGPLYDSAWITGD